MDTKKLEGIRHSLAHLLATSVLELYPGAENAIGPAIEDGFYQEFELPHTISEKDFPAIEKKMREKLNEWKKLKHFSHQEVSADEARKIFKWNKYKTELINDFEREGKKITLYTLGNFVDLCKGGHEQNMEDIKLDGVKLERVAGAYWKGNEKNIMLSRIYGLAFESKEKLADYLHMLEEAKKRDHKKIGKEQELFFGTDDVGGGLPIFMPKGFQLRRAFENFLIAEKEKRGYVYVWTPHIAKTDLYVQSGHLSKYDAMYAPMEIDEESYVLKAMNCPHHFQIYLEKKRSYRELPMRIAEHGTVYRNEKSGELNGLFRCRALTIDDTHIFVRHDQILSEYSNVISLIKFVFNRLGFKKFRVRISTRDEAHAAKYIGDKKLWDTAEKAIEEATKQNDLPYYMGPGEAAFYGPKIDFMIEDAIGREWQCSTAQLDFVQPENFNLEYTGEDGKDHRPAVLHIAVVGSIERMLGVLIEHYAGVFPLWLAPVQVKILPVSEPYLEYANGVARELRENGFRVEVDDSAEKLGKKIRNAELQKIPYMVVVGEKEMSENMVNVRSYVTKEQKSMGVKEFLGNLKGEL